jgi:ABC-type phosphate/phosphonate transport system permease subunit
VLNNLRWGSIFSFVGLGLLGVALYVHIEYTGGATAAFLTFGAIIGGVGLALLITFFVAKNYLKKETEKEEKELVEKE